tara:strand:- start:87 stop:701 length:615 start_codon:yes stop_codon:yes gene_type:complete
MHLLGYNMPRTKSSGPSARKSKKAESDAPAAPAPAPPASVDVASVADEESNSVVEWSMSGEFNTVLSEINTLRSSLTSLAGHVRDLQKRSERELKSAQKSAKKRRTKNTNRKPSGFVKPTLITDELAIFLGKESGTLMARTEVTREINSYIREHKLQNPKNGRHILPDKKLGKLLRVGKNDELTYFNLQKFMSPHFVKTTPTTA